MIIVIRFLMRIPLGLNQLPLMNDLVRYKGYMSFFITQKQTKGKIPLILSLVPYFLGNKKHENSRVYMNKSPSANLLLGLVMKREDWREIQGECRLANEISMVCLLPFCLNPLSAMLKPKSDCLVSSTKEKKPKFDQPNMSSFFSFHTTKAPLQVFKTSVPFWFHQAIIQLSCPNEGKKETMKKQ